MSESQVFTLADLADEAGDEGVDLSKKQGPYKSPFENNKAYKVVVTEQEVKESKNGWLQVELKLDFVDSATGEAVKSAGRQWIMLPVFTDEKRGAEDPEKLSTLEASWGKSFHNLLRAAYPAVFSIYSRLDKNGRNWKFYDMEGEEMDKKAKVAREKLVGKAVLTAAKRLVAGNFDLTGINLYLVQTQDASKTPAKTYINFFNDQPEKYELAEVSDR